MGEVYLMIELRLYENTYVTKEEADSFIRERYMSTSPEYKAWFEHEGNEEDLIVALIQSALALNTYKYTGRKLRQTQELAFPRRKYAMPGVYYLPFVYQSSDLSLTDGSLGADNGLKNAKAAQIKNALAHLVLGNRVVVDSKRRQLSGISSKKADDIAETYNDNNDASYYARIGIYAKEEVEAELKSWLTQSVYTL